MSALLPVFVNNLLPILLATAAGALLARRMSLDPRPLSQVAFYIFSPCLIFNLVATSTLDGGDILRMMAFTGIGTLAVGGLTWFGCRLLRFEKRTMTAVLLTSMFMNAGNYGLPVVLFTFGDETLHHATLFFVTNIIMSYSFGVFIASIGGSSLREAAGNLARVPALYALLLGFIFLWQGWQLPSPLERTVGLLADAAIPSMLILLGMQLQTIRWAGRFRPVALASFMRLMIGPGIALLLGPGFGLQSAALRAGVVESAMPAAVFNTVLATEYDVEPSLVTAVVFTTTLISPITLTPLLFLLGT